MSKIKYLTQKEAADYAGVKPRTIRRWEKQEGMPVKKGAKHKKYIP